MVAILWIITIEETCKHFRSVFQPDHLFQTMTSPLLSLVARKVSL